MEHFTLQQLNEQWRQAAGDYLEFLRIPSMSAGLYRLSAGAADPQAPHTEDEVYVVLAGAGRLRVGDQDLQVGAGSVIVVPARVEHRFHTITDDLDVLVFFAPAEGASAEQVAAPGR
jgi:mannose-6-phosphate isomerase-like protein (cupin superfamily)